MKIIDIVENKIDHLSINSTVQKAPLLKKLFKVSCETCRHESCNCGTCIAATLVHWSTSWTKNNGVYRMALLMGEFVGCTTKQLQLSDLSRGT